MLQSPFRVIRAALDRDSPFRGRTRDVADGCSMSVRAARTRHKNAPITASAPDSTTELGMPHTDFFDEPDSSQRTNRGTSTRARTQAPQAGGDLDARRHVPAGAAFTAGAGDLAANKLQANDPCSQQANAPLVADDACATGAAAPATDARPRLLP
jgi:hypothetical protein